MSKPLSFTGMLSEAATLMLDSKLPRPSITLIRYGKVHWLGSGDEIVKPKVSKSTATAVNPGADGRPKK